jgi:hypothetical protein
MRSGLRDELREMFGVHRLRVILRVPVGHEHPSQRAPSRAPSRSESGGAQGYQR